MSTTDDKLNFLLLESNVGDDTTDGQLEGSGGATSDREESRTEEEEEEERKGKDRRPVTVSTRAYCTSGPTRANLIFGSLLSNPRPPSFLRQQ